MPKYKQFNGSIEIIVETKNKKEAEKFFSKLSEKIIKNNHNVYNVKYTKLEEY